jgi:glycosyltransferase involved in cell wall biosynthesis
MILFDSVYIHQGGGKTILNILLSYILKNKLNEYYFIFDKRYEESLLNKIPKEQFSLLSSSEVSRRNFYLKNYNKFNTFFCLGNVPPPIYLRDKKVTIYFQNELLLKARLFNLKESLFWIKRQYISLLKINNYKWVVQTELMKNKLTDGLKISNKMIKILPVFPILKKNKKHSKLNNSFIYVASGEYHKNHERLVKAMLMASKKLNKSINLYVTLENNRFKDLLEKISSQNSKFQIQNLGVLKQDLILDYYSKSKFLIYPSVFESFGLPLIEASQQDCVVLASDLPYVKEVISNFYSFDPLDINDISLAIEKVIYLEDPNKSVLKIKSEETALINYLND